MEKEERIKLILKKTKRGLTITDIVKESIFSRSTIVNVLSRLEGANKVSYRRIGMAKVYTLKNEEN